MNASGRRRQPSRRLTHLTFTFPERFDLGDSRRSLRQRCSRGRVGACVRGRRCPMWLLRTVERRDISVVGQDGRQRNGALVAAWLTVS